MRVMQYPDAMRTTLAIDDQLLKAAKRRAGRRGPPDRTPAMILIDVNVLLAVHRLDHPHHAAVKPWFDDARAGTERFPIPDSRYPI